jgi:hypothetical protein
LTIGLVLNNFNLIEIKLLLKKINIFLLFISLLGIFQVILFFFFGYDNYVQLIIRSIDTFKLLHKSYQNFFQYLGGADSYVVFNSTPIPRFSGYIDQSSAVSVILYFPVSLNLILDKKIPIYAYPIIFFSIFSLGASTYICLVLALAVYLMLKYIPRFKKAVLLAPIFIFSLTIILFLLFPNAFIHGAVPFEKTYFIADNSLLDYIYGRSASGIARLSIISDCLQAFLSSFFMGVPIGDPIGFGQIFLSYGQRYGIVPLIAIVYIFFKIVK